MEQLFDLVGRLPERHRAALHWFAEHSGNDVRWPNSLSDGTKLASKAKGIYKPEWTKYALSIRQSLLSPYPDQDPMVRSDGTWSYLYFQENIDPNARDLAYTNRGLTACWQDHVPVAVMRQISAKPHAAYKVLGLALVIGWSEGYFILEGFSSEGQVRDSGSASEFREAMRSVGAGESDTASIQSIPDARERIFASIVRRRGQPEFRQCLLEAYEGRCTVTGCEATEALEAAHIVPYLGPASNCPGNGLLLRADIHTLFDLGLISVDTTTMQVLVSPTVGDISYKGLSGRSLRLPKDKAHSPSPLALDQHRTWCGL